MGSSTAGGSVIRLNERLIPTSGPKPKPRDGERVLGETKSLCPTCYGLLPAILVEREGKVYIRRICPEHGEIEGLYWGDAEYFQRAMKFETEGMSVTSNVGYDAPCPFSCGLCPEHEDMTCLANLVATNRCNFSCWYCFFYAEKMGFVHEPTLDQVRQMIRVLRSQGPVKPNAVQITGGEPTLREDLVEMVEIMREEGIMHVQLNTNGILFAHNLDYLVELRNAGVNTLYLSFDGVSPKINTKNHWEVPYILENARKAKMSSVLVPTIVRGWNDHELGDIVRFAVLNMDVIRGVDFQPVSIVGQVPREKRKEMRITIPDVIKKIEEQTDGQIPSDAWYPIPIAGVFSDFIQALTRRPQIRFSNHPACGAATYVFPEFETAEGKRKTANFIPITEFVDVEAIYEYLKEKVEALEKGANRYLTMARFLAKLPSFVDRKRQPEGLDLIRLLKNIFVRRNYDALGKFHDRALFLGMMHFMDLYNYDIQRVIRCNVHYLSPNRTIIPFCAYNVLPDLYRDRFIEQDSLSLEEYSRTYGPTKIGEAVKYRRDAEKLSSGEAYKRTYAPFLEV